VTRERAGVSAGLFRSSAIFLLNSTPEREHAGVSFALKRSRYQLRGKINKGCCLRHSVVRAQSPSCARTETDDARLHDCCRNGAWFGRCMGRPGAIRCLNLGNAPIVRVHVAKGHVARSISALSHPQPGRRSNDRGPVPSSASGQPHQRRAERTTTRPASAALTYSPACFGGLDVFA